MRGWCVEVWGDYACFTRPEIKGERVSYDVMTPLAAKAILEAILWKPAIQWNVTRIEVLNPIKWFSVRRSDIGDAEDPRRMRPGLILVDVRYRIHAYFDFIPPGKRSVNRAIAQEVWLAGQAKLEKARPDETEAKYAAMFERRAKKGQCFLRPYLGCREFVCDFRLVDAQREQAALIDETRDLGFMLYDMDYEQSEAEPLSKFFRATIEKGSVNTDHRHIELRG